MRNNTETHFFLFSSTLKQGRNSFLLLRKEETIFNFKEEYAKGAFYKAAPLESLLNHKVKPHMYQRGVRILFAVPKLRYNAQKRTQRHLLTRPHSSATTQWSAFFPP